MEKGIEGNIYHLSPDQGVAVRDVVRTICEKMGKKFDECTVGVAERLGQDAAYVIDSTRARTELGWAPKISLEQGLQGVVSWIDEKWGAISKESLDYVHKA
jgi:dTDP-glucose 4,6-dehydratase